MRSRPGCAGGSGSSSDEQGRGAYRAPHCAARWPSTTSPGGSTSSLLMLIARLDGGAGGRELHRPLLHLNVVELPGLREPEPEVDPARANQPIAVAKTTLALNDQVFTVAGALLEAHKPARVVRTPDHNTKAVVLEPLPGIAERGRGSSDRGSTNTPLLCFARRCARPPTLARCTPIIGRATTT